MGSLRGAVLLAALPPLPDAPSAGRRSPVAPPHVHCTQATSPPSSHCPASLQALCPLHTSPHHTGVCAAMPAGHVFSTLTLPSQLADALAAAAVGLGGAQPGKAAGACVCGGLSWCVGAGVACGCASVRLSLRARPPSVRSCNCTRMQLHTHATAHATAHACNCACNCTCMQLRMQLHTHATAHATAHACNCTRMQLHTHATAHATAHACTAGQSEEAVLPLVNTRPAAKGATGACGVWPAAFPAPAAAAAAEAAAPAGAAAAAAAAA